MHFVSAIDSIKGSMKAVLGLHETVCSGAADGYARMARKPALTLLHLGPGLANGLSNFHNARRSGSPVVSLVGEMATWHKDADPLLNMDVEALAKTVSKYVQVCSDGDNLYDAMSRACEAAIGPQYEIGGSNIATIIVPHNLSWEKDCDTMEPPSNLTNHHQYLGPDQEHQIDSFVDDCSSALKSAPIGKVALYIGGKAAIQDGGALMNIGKIASKLGAPLYCENAFSRLDRGHKLPNLVRLPYFPDDAIAALKKFTTLLVVDARRPVANFGYENGESRVMHQPDDNLWEVDSTIVDVPLVLTKLVSALGADSVIPLVNCKGSFCSPKRPSVPNGRLNPSLMCQTVAALQPEGAIIVDESLTSGNSYWEFSRGCPPFSHLALTGGAIGCGPPLSVGAAIACPNRKVINLQADGSCMYSVQALWTQVREDLDVITIICANRTYAILKVELAKQKIVPR